MGDLTELMLEGVLAEDTGEYVGPPCGYPRNADGTVGPDHIDIGDPLADMVPVEVGGRKPWACPECRKQFKTVQAVWDHMRDAHFIE